MDKQTEFYYVNEDFETAGISYITKNNCEQDETYWTRINETDDEVIEKFYAQARNFSNTQFKIVDGDVVIDETIELIPLKDEKEEESQLVKVMAKTLIVNNLVVPQEVKDIVKNDAEIIEFEHKKTYDYLKTVRYLGKLYIQQQPNGYPANNTSHVPGGAGMSAIWKEVV